MEIVFDKTYFASYMSVNYGGVGFGGKDDFGGNERSYGGVDALDESSPPALTISTTSLDNANEGSAYSFTLQSGGGVGVKTWSIVSGTLPDGLSLDSDTGEISGTPTATDDETVTFRVTDANGSTADKQLALTVIAQAPSVTTNALDEASVDEAYSFTLQADNGEGSLTWSIVSGTLPDGLSLNANTGEISGTPTATAAEDLVFRVTDIEGQTGDSGSLTLTVVDYGVKWTDDFVRGDADGVGGDWVEDATNTGFRILNNSMTRRTVDGNAEVWVPSGDAVVSGKTKMKFEAKGCLAQQGNARLEFGMQSIAGGYEDSGNDGYFLRQWSAGDLRIYRVLNGVGAVIATVSSFGINPTTPVDAAIELEKTGDTQVTITVYKNGIGIDSHVDNSPSTALDIFTTAYPFVRSVLTLQDNTVIDEAEISY